MNKTELIKVVADKSGLSVKDATAAVNSFIGVVTNELVEGNKVQLVGFGTFETAVRAGREGFNPKTREKIDIKASVVPKFKAGKALKDAVNA